MLAANRTPSRLVIGIDVRPPLLASALARLVRSDEVEPVVLEEPPDLRHLEETLDILVTSRHRVPPAADATGVLVLRVVEDEEPMVTSNDADEADAYDDIVDLARLSEVLDRIDRWQADRTARGGSPV